MLPHEEAQTARERQMRKREREREERTIAATVKAGEKRENSLHFNWQNVKRNIHSWTCYRYGKFELVITRTLGPNVFCTVVFDPGVEVLSVHTDIFLRDEHSTYAFLPFACSYPT